MPVQGVLVNLHPFVKRFVFLLVDEGAVVESKFVPNVLLLLDGSCGIFLLLRLGKWRKCISYVWKMEEQGKISSPWFEQLYFRV